MVLRASPFLLLLLIAYSCWADQITGILTANSYVSPDALVSAQTLPVVQAPAVTFPTQAFSQAFDGAFSSYVVKSASANQDVGTIDITEYNAATAVPPGTAGARLDASYYPNGSLPLSTPPPSSPNNWIQIVNKSGAYGNMQVPSYAFAFVDGDPNFRPPKSPIALGPGYYEPGETLTEPLNNPLVAGDSRPIISSGGVLSFSDHPARPVSFAFANQQNWTATLYPVNITGNQITVYGGFSWGWTMQNDMSHGAILPYFADAGSCAGNFCIGLGTNTFRWGIAQGSPRTLTFNPNTDFSLAKPSTPFLLGSLTYTNGGPLYSGFAPSTIDLDWKAFFPDNADVNPLGQSEIFINQDGTISLIFAGPFGAESYFLDPRVGSSQTLNIYGEISEQQNLQTLDTTVGIADRDYDPTATGPVTYSIVAADVATTATPEPKCIDLSVAGLGFLALIRKRFSISCLMRFAGSLLNTQFG